MSFNLNTSHVLFIILVALVASGFIIWTYRYARQQLSRKAAWSLILLRCAAVILLLLILCEPTARLLINHTEPARLLLLVDTSSSMGITDRLGLRREKLQQLLTGPLIKSLTNSYRVETYQFAEEVAPLAASRFDSLTLFNAATDIGASLTFAQTRTQLDSLSGIILMTDGNFTVGRDPLRAVTGLSAPIYTIGIGDTLESRDISITNSLTNEVAYVDSKVPVEITVRSQGIAPTRVPVTLSEDNLTLDTQYLDLTGDGREQSVTLHLTPVQEGVHRYTVGLPVLAGEVTTRNNQRDFFIKVLKSKLRILYIEGAPRPDITFLKRSLDKDANLALTTVVFRPDGTTFASKMPQTQSEWFTYDLIILGSIDEDRIRKWESSIVAFVEQKGGGLVALGGPHSFNLGGYAGTPISSLLPIRIDTDARGMFENQFVPVLTPDGQVHPIMKLHEDAVVSGQRWADLPPLPGINLVGPVKPGATPLAIHPTWQIAGANAPVVAVQRYGLGKVMAITTHELWRWELVSGGTGDTDASYDRFWGNTVRWLTRYEGGQRVRVTSEKPLFRSGEPVGFQGQVYDENYRPVTDATLTTTIQSKQTGEEPIRMTLSPATAGNGQYTGSVRYLPPGKYTFLAQGTLNGKDIGSDQGGFTVGESGIEYQQTRMNRELLTQLAVSTGGRFYPASKANQLSADVSFPDTITKFTQETRFWNHPALFILFVVLLSAEWLLRRRYGFQ